MIFATGLLNCLNAKTPSFAAGNAPTTIANDDDTDKYVFPSLIANFRVKLVDVFYYLLLVFVVSPLTTETSFFGQYHTNH